jgi:cytosine/adenosine deaminase-related metal-dependent hydrolase
LSADLVVLDYAATSADRLDDAPDELELLLTRARKEHVKSVVVAGHEIARDSILRSIDLVAAETELWRRRTSAGRRCKRATICAAVCTRRFRATNAVGHRITR